MKNYKIAVLLNLDKSAQITLKSAVSLAKMINGDIEVFSVKKPNEIVKRENQLSAMRTISSKRTLITKKMQELITPISKEHGVEIKHSFVIGNVRNEIKDFIEDRQPDILVLGKRKAKLFNLFGDNFTGCILDVFKGAVMIANGKQALEPNKEITIGTLNSAFPELGLEFARDLIQHSKEPLKSFKTVNHAIGTDKTKESSDGKTIEYVFEDGDNAINSISNFITKSNVNLLYIDRVDKNSNKKSNLRTSNIKNIVDKTNVNLLLTGS